MTDEELYEIYVRIFGKVRSGTKLENDDYGERSLDGFSKYPEDGRTVVALASEDAAIKAPMRSKKDLLARLGELIG